MQDLVSLLSEMPETGKSLGKNIYKIRLSVKSKGKGKSGGMRVITYFYSSDNELYLLNLYDKSEQDSVSFKEIQSIINSIIE